MFDDYMPQPRRQDASLAWMGLVASVVITMALVRFGVSLVGPTVLGPPHSVRFLIHGEGNIETIAEGPTRNQQSCSGDCLLAFPSGAKEIVITYQPAARSKFRGWGGACIGSDEWCRITLGEYKVVTVSFERE